MASGDILGHTLLRGAGQLTNWAAGDAASPGPIGDQLDEWVNVMWFVQPTTSPLPTDSVAGNQLRPQYASIGTTSMSNSGLLADNTPNWKLRISELYIHTSLGYTNDPAGVGAQLEFRDSLPFCLCRLLHWTGSPIGSEAYGGYETFLPNSSLTVHSGVPLANLQTVLQVLREADGLPPSSDRTQALAVAELTSAAAGAPYIYHQTSGEPYRSEYERGSQNWSFIPAGAPIDIAEGEGMNLQMKIPSNSGTNANRGFEYDVCAIGWYEEIA